jgi:hypothetical protein
MAGIVSCKGVDSATPVTEDRLALNAVNAPADNTVNIKTFDKVKNALVTDCPKVLKEPLHFRPM